MFRCRYRLSDMVVLGGTRGASAGDFDDAEHGTTIEFNGRMPKANEKVYDDTSGSEALNDNVGFGEQILVTTSATDTDGDGIPDVAADGVAVATISLDKRDRNGNPARAASDNDDFFAEVSGGELDASSGSLVNGQATVTLQPSQAKGLVVTVEIRPKNTAILGEAVRVKFI